MSTIRFDARPSVGAFLPTFVMILDLINNLCYCADLPPSSEDFGSVPKLTPCKCIIALLYTRCGYTQFAKKTRFGKRTDNFLIHNHFFQST